VVNLPVVHIVGLGLPACIFAWHGLRRAIAEREQHVLWLTHGAAIAFAIYMVVLGPVTYYRHYLPLLPTVALLSAYGLWETRWSKNKLVLGVFCLYPLLLTVDSERNYAQDPRRQLTAWAEEKGNPRVLSTFYVSPPKSLKSRIFNADQYLAQGQQYLQQAQYVVLSENWYDTAFTNELTGPFSSNPEWAIRTKPEYVVMYRHMLANIDPNLELEAEFDMQHFMPEFLIHRRFYGPFQRFIGDVKVLKVL
jgi:hypothetical protein